MFYKLPSLLHFSPYFFILSNIKTPSTSTCTEVIMPLVFSLMPYWSPYGDHTQIISCQVKCTLYLIFPGTSR